MNEHEKTKSQKYLDCLKQNFDFTDIWRDRNKTVRKYTWSQPSPLVRCRLDYFLIEKNMINSVINTGILPSVKSDHSIIELYININGPDRGPGFWKLNTSILNEPDYQRKIKQLIDEVWDKSFHISDICVRFDWLKYHIRNFSIKYCKYRAKKKREREKYIINELNYLYKKIVGKFHVIMNLNMSLKVLKKRELKRYGLDLV